MKPQRFTIFALAAGLLFTIVAISGGLDARSLRARELKDSALVHPNNKGLSSFLRQEPMPFYQETQNNATSTNDTNDSTSDSTAACQLEGITIHHNGAKYIVGRSHRSGSIYATCNNGQLTCYEDNGIADADTKDHKQVECDSRMINQRRRHLGVIIEEKDGIWPNGTVWYRIDEGFEQKHKDLIEKAMDHYHATNIAIKFQECEPVTKCNNKYLNIVQNEDSCHSLVGYMNDGQPQELNLGKSCFVHGHGTVVHELGHALGLYHEHTHPKREVIILTDSNLPVSASNYIKETQAILKPYDKGSIMHYGRNAGLCLPKSQYINASFCGSVEEGQKCVLAESFHCDDNRNKEIGQRKQLSEGDINSLKAIYGTRAGTSPWFIQTPTTSTPLNTNSSSPPLPTSQTLTTSTPLNTNSSSPPLPTSQTPTNQLPTTPPTTEDPTLIPTLLPTLLPTTEDPTFLPTSEDSTFLPTTEDPIVLPTTEDPTFLPTTEDPTFLPTTEDPIPLPTTEDSRLIPTTEDPTFLPTPEDPTVLLTPEYSTFLPTPEYSTFLPTTEDPTFLPTSEDPTFLPTTEDPTVLLTPEDPTFLPTPEDPTVLPTPEYSTFLPTPEDPTFLPTPEDRTSAIVPTLHVAPPISEPVTPTEVPNLQLSQITFGTI
jgi:hypothetical protein